MKGAASVVRAIGLLGNGGSDGRLIKDHEKESLVSRAKLALLAALASCALVAATSAAAASAHEYKVEGSGITKHYPFAHIHEEGKEYVLLGTPFGVAVHIVCTTVLVAGGGILPEGKDYAKLEYGGCTATKPANCTVKEPIVTNVDSELIEFERVLVTKFSPLEAGVFTEITLEGASCALRGKPFKVEGTQNCEIPGHATEAVEHEVNCVAGGNGSELKAGGKAATFSGTVAKLKLESGQKWSAV